MQIDWKWVWDEFNAQLETDAAYEDAEGYTSLAYNWPLQSKLIESLVDDYVRRHSAD